MNPLILRFDQFAQLAASALITVAWQAVLLTLVTAVVLRGLPRLSAAARFTAWAAVFVLLLLLPFAPPARTAGTLTGLQVSSQWSIAAALLWVALSIGRAVLLAREFLRLRWIARRAQPLPLSVAPGIDPKGARAAQLCLSHDVLRPSVIGFFHPRILIPQDLYGHLTPAELNHILLHEQHHLRRRDDWLNLLQKLGLVLFPLNPALLWVERRLCFERELACDESVLAATHAPVSYARSLVSLAEHTLLGRRLALALGAWEQRSELSRRVHRILAARGPALSPRSASTALALLCAGLLASAGALSRAPRLVSLSDIGEAQPASFASAADALPALEAVASNRRSSPAVSASVPVTFPVATQTRLMNAMMSSPAAAAPARKAQRRIVDRPRTAPAGRLPAAYVASPQTQPSLQRTPRFAPPYRTISASIEPGLSSPRVAAHWRETTLALPDAAPALVFAVFSSSSGSPAYAAVPRPLAGWCSSCNLHSTLEGVSSWRMKLIN